MPTRLNLIVGDDIPSLLSKIAGGERKRGEYITRLVRSVYAGEQDVSGTDLEMLRLTVAGLAGKVKALEGETLRLQRQVDLLTPQHK